MKKIFNNKWIMLIGVLLVGIIIGRLILPSSNESTHQHIDSSKNQHIDQIWTCSMHPQIQQSGPGKCPLCAMDLIPVESSLEVVEQLPNEVPMSESAMKLAEIQTYKVSLEKPEKEIRLLGKVKPDERMIFSQAIHFPGRVEKLFVNFTGEKVVKGQKLATVYSSELVTAQKELFEVLKDKETSPMLVEAARNKLKQWKFSNKQIEDLEKSGKVETNVDILSDYTGFVMERNVSEGDHYMEGQALFKITDLSKVWVLFEAYENDLPWIKEGDILFIDLKSIPGKTFKGKVSFIDPFINPKTRVANVRVELPNNEGKLKPDMFANGIINSKLSFSEEVILVPKSAVLWTGKRAIVYVKLADRDHSSFIHREVVLGEDAGAFYVIKEGLADGEVIASNGVFKIDAAAQLAGKKSMMNPTGKKINKNEASHSANTSTPIEFRKQLGVVILDYLRLKDKLTDDNKDIENEIIRLQKSQLKIDATILDAELKEQWFAIKLTMDKELKKLSKTVTIEEQRNVFLSLSNSMFEAVKTFGVELDEESLYLEFCPMADNNNGGFWLSSEKEIRNPYFGSSMLKCGSVKEVLVKN